MVLVLTAASALFALLALNSRSSSVRVRVRAACPWHFHVFLGPCSIRCPDEPLHQFGLLQVSSTEISAKGSVVNSYLQPSADEKTMVHSAESATASFADHDVSAAVLKARAEAKAEYQSMMMSALGAEAKAHKMGQKATEQALAAQEKAEKARLMQRRMRAQTDEARQDEKDMREQARMATETDRSLTAKIMLGQ